MSRKQAATAAACRSRVRRSRSEQREHRQQHARIPPHGQQPDGRDEGDQRQGKQPVHRQPDGQRAARDKNAAYEDQHKGDLRDQGQRGKPRQIAAHVRGLFITDRDKIGVDRKGHAADPTQEQVADPAQPQRIERDGGVVAEHGRGGDELEDAGAHGLPPVRSITA